MSQAVKVGDRVKPGDRAWFRGYYVEWSDGSRHASQIEVESSIPDHLCLPAVARWLSETPSGAAVVHRALARLASYRARFPLTGEQEPFLPEVEQEAVLSLIAALTPPAGASEAEGGEL